MKNRGQNGVDRYLLLTSNVEDRLKEFEALDPACPFMHASANPTETFQEIYPVIMELCIFCLSSTSLYN